MSILTALFALTVAHAIDSGRCPNRRLDGKGWAFEKIPAYDQNKANLKGQDICYSIVAASLIDDYRFRHGDKLEKITSPLSIAVNHKANLGALTELDEVSYDEKESTNKQLGPGKPLLALQTNRTMRACDQRYLEQFASLIPGSVPKFEKSSFQDFIGASLVEMRKLSETADSLEESEGKLGEYYKCRVNGSMTNMHALVDASKAAMKEGDPIPQMAKFMNRFCKDHAIDLDYPAPKLAMNPEPDVIASLLEDSIPVAISYCGDPDEPKKCGEPDHDSVVIGQRFRNDKCEFLVRDSIKTSHEIWMSEDTIRKSVSKAHWLP